MKQFTVYAPNQQMGFEPAYVVAFTQDGPVAYAMNEDWEETADDLQKRLQTQPPRSRTQEPDPPYRHLL